MTHQQRSLLQCCRGPHTTSLRLVESQFDIDNPTTASQLEQYLTKRLAVECPEEEWEDGTNNEDDDVVQFAIRNDAHWLHCQTSRPLLTILGIYEDENDPLVPVNVSYWKAEQDIEEEEESCSCKPSHSEWKRTNRQIPNPSTPSCYHVRWIDFRSLKKNIFLSSPEQVWHCLTSVLGNQHWQNPWINDESEETPHMVVFLLSQSCPLLKDFRVSDACPAWFFHGYAYLDEWETDSFSPVVMYMYKRLKPRVRLTLQHPIDNTLPPKGCLWEMVPPKQNEDDDHIQQLPDEPTYRIVSPPYLNLEEEYGSHIAQGLFSPDVIKIFRQEALAIPQWTPWPETQHYSIGPNGETTWTVFPLCYCFPAHDVSQRTWVEQTRHYCPNTCQILQSILGDRLRTALFSQLNPQTTLEAHTGWADLANAVLRLHIPLVVVPKLCGTWVDGCMETHQVGRPILFDDSKIHRAFNYSTESRIVLIVDLERPTGIPLGWATGGHSNELDQFIAQMSVPK